MDLNGEHRFFFGRVTAGDAHALVFVNVGALPALLEARSAHIDATFHSTPRGYYQLVSVHAISHGISIQAATFLMTAKTQALYEACLARLNEVCLQQTGRMSK
jgi:hypothetical protein